MRLSGSCIHLLILASVAGLRYFVQTLLRYHVLDPHNPGWIVCTCLVLCAGRLLLSREQLATRALTEALARVESFLDGAVLDE